MNEELEILIKKIFKIIDTYYDEEEAIKISELIESYSLHVQQCIDGGE